MVPKAQVSEPQEPGQEGDRCREHTVRGPSRLAAAYVRCRRVLSDPQFPRPANGEKVLLGPGPACVSTAQPVRTRRPLVPRWVTRANRCRDHRVSGPVWVQGHRNRGGPETGGKVPTLQKCVLFSAMKVVEPGQGQGWDWD